MSITTVLPNDLDLDVRFPTNGWIFPCEFCGIATFKNIILANKYRFYVCNSCKITCNEDKLYKKLFVIENNSYHQVCYKRWKHKYTKCTCSQTDNASV